MALTEWLAERIAATSYEDIPEDAIAVAKDAVLDTTGVTLAGSIAEPARIVAQSCGALVNPGPSLIFGTSRRSSLLEATLVNGTASHAYDFDDCSNTLGGHPSAPILPALWAMAEDLGVTGRDFLLAYVVGVETETKIGRAVNFHHYEKGWHPTSTLGTFGSAAACAKLLGLAPEQTAIALAIAASMASGLKANFGTMTKPYHVGHCARNGLLAALLAKNGMTADVGTFEHHQGFLEVFNGAGTYDIEKAKAGWGAPFDVIEPGIAFKRYPCCASTHPAIDALLDLRARHGLTPDNVKRVVSWTHPRRFKHTNRPDPRSGFEGKFSVQYVLARALQNGLVSLNDFTDEAVQDQEIRRMLREVITADAHPKARGDETEIYYAEITIDTVDGRTVSQFVDAPVGRDRDHPLPPGALEAKFDDCAQQVLDGDSVRQLRERLLSLDKESNMSDVTRLIERAVCPRNSQLGIVA